MPHNWLPEELEELGPGLHTSRLYRHHPAWHRKTAGNGNETISDRGGTNDPRREAAGASTLQRRSANAFEGRYRPIFLSTPAKAVFRPRTGAVILQLEDALSASSSARSVRFSC